MNGFDVACWALFCRADRARQCPKSGGERTQRGHAAAAEFGPQPDMGLDFETARRL